MLTILDHQCADSSNTGTSEFCNSPRKLKLIKFRDKCDALLPTSRSDILDWCHQLQQFCSPSTNVYSNSCFFRAQTTLLPNCNLISQHFIFLFTQYIFTLSANALPLQYSLWQTLQDLSSYPHNFEFTRAFN